uniref:Uncharacterized protein n=1 Tax=Caenorhabditis tropicalis TaxID=1561998 RepID=A0A1I7UKE6_9PELO
MPLCVIRTMITTVDVCCRFHSDTLISHSLLFFSLSFNLTIMKFFILYVAFFFFLHQSEANASVVNASYDIDAAVNASDVNASATNATESKASDVNASAINAFADDPSGVNASDVNAAAANTSAGMDVKSSSFSRFESSMTLVMREIDLVFDSH